MLTQEQAVEIRVLRRQRMGIRAIPKELGLSRRTVRRYLRDPGAQRYGRREPRPTKLGPYISYVLGRVEAARPKWIPATALLREIREQGYPGGISQLVRFETEPGEQLQADFTHVRRGRDPLLAFVATLGYSRASFVRFTVAEDAITLCTCLREALMYFGGVPAHVLLDNASTMVTERDAYGEGEHRFHRDLLALRGVWLPGEAMPPVPGQDQGQSRALQRLPQVELLGAARCDLEAVGAQARCDGGERPHRSLAAEGRQRARAWDDRRGAERAPRARALQAPAAAGNNRFESADRSGAAHSGAAAL